ncbi:MAG: F0F1 ATP synthase subunit delta [Clostridiales bacterium]|uniref:F0F1 ATP synthase subunit delta n=1 Tax=Clostridium sp. N3C TaxID=1776758 RepID=UPI00092DF2CD|nr:F0F1 ATP synthase subunit delta [Clostridium sp. N3C]NLZ47276.1 F0F1 ATP synthase subunit delta [Clostridiales bacterium]SCN23904.1 F-type ATPase subunit delta [Clostridium sp. N3C]
MYEYLDHRYALALYEIAEEKGKEELVLNQLREVIDLIYGNEDIMMLLKHPEINLYKKKETFELIFKGRVEEEIYNFLMVLLDKDRILFLKEKLYEMEKIHLEKNNTLLAKVRSALPLNDDEREKLLENLKKKYNKKIIIEEEVDTSLIGGIFVKVGEDVIDGSIKGRLEKLKEAMLK